MDRLERRIEAVARDLDRIAPRLEALKDAIAFRVELLGQWVQRLEDAFNATVAVPAESGVGAYYASAEPLEPHSA